MRWIESSGGNEKKSLKEPLGPLSSPSIPHYPAPQARSKAWPLYASRQGSAGQIFDGLKAQGPHAYVGFIVNFFGSVESSSRIRTGHSDGAANCPMSQPRSVHGHGSN